MGLGIKPFTQGLHELANGGYAWLQPDGGWGWSNAGLIVDGDVSIVVDTLFDKRLASDMLVAMKNAEMMHKLMQAAPGMGEVGEFFLHCFSAFDFEGINRTLPSRTFSGALDLLVGDKPVHLRQVGPAHTKGDVLVYVPGDKTMFTGDILFIEGHPILWAGPVSNWIDACDYMLALELETIVPGHGPITDHRGVKALQGYLIYVRDEAKKTF